MTHIQPDGGRIMWGRSARDRDRLARIALLSEEADEQRDIAAARLTSTMTKASLLLVGAGLIAATWAVDLIGRPYGMLPAATMVFALAAAAAALFSLFPRSNLNLKVRTLIERSLEPSGPTRPELADLILEAKAVVIDSLTAEHRKRDRWVRIGYVLLGIALAGGAASIVAALLFPSVSA